MKYFLPTLWIGETFSLGDNVATAWSVAELVYPRDSRWHWIPISQVQQNNVQSEGREWDGERVVGERKHYWSKHCGLCGATVKRQVATRGYNASGPEVAGNDSVVVGRENGFMTHGWRERLRFAGVPLKIGFRSLREFACQCT